MKIRLTIGKLMIEIESESEEVKIEREDTPDPSQTSLKEFDRILMPFKRPDTVIPTQRKAGAGRPRGARDLQPREPSHCSTCDAVHRKATMRRAGADGRPHCVECDPNPIMASIRSYIGRVD